MDSKKIILIVIAIAIIVFGAAYLLGSSTHSNVNVTVNNTTNVSSNVTNATNVTNVTSDDTAQSSALENYESSSQSSSGSSDPKYGSSSYVERWDQSQRAGDSWAYTHDQPVKTDSNGNEYKRMYDEDSGESYWYKMNQ